MKSKLKSSVATLIATAAFLSPASHADMSNLGYVIDQKNVVVISGRGECVRSGSWTPALAAVAAAATQCTPDLVAQAQPTPPAAPAPKAAPAQKPAAKPEAKAGAAAPKPAPQKFTFAADALFDFDKATLKPEGKTKLDPLPQSLSDVKYDAVVVVGHTDRIGTVKYNQKLSLKRAETVRKYLADKGIAANRISVEGKGKSQPVTQGATCKGKKSKALIACLQPDRRVTIEVTGTK